MCSNDQPGTKQKTANMPENLGGGHESSVAAQPICWCVAIFQGIRIGLSGTSDNFW